jgi:hypothetical protein
MDTQINEQKTPRNRHTQIQASHLQQRKVSSVEEWPLFLANGTKTNRCPSMKEKNESRHRLHSFCRFKNTLKM